MTRRTRFQHRVTAVLEATPVGWIGRLESPDTGRLDLAAWRVDGGPIKQGFKQVELPGIGETIPRKLRLLPDHAIVSFPAHTPTPERPTFLTEWKLVRVMESDPDLDPIVKRLRKPVFIKMASGGRLRLERGIFPIFSGRVRWIRGTSLVDIPAKAEKADLKALAALDEMFARRREWNDRAVEYTRTRVHRYFKKLWGDEFTITADELARRAVLESLSMYKGGRRFRMWYDVGDAFGDHALVLDGSIGRGFTEINMM
jgi:hypothetical protein